MDSPLFYELDGYSDPCVDQSKDIRPSRPSWLRIGHNTNSSSSNNNNNNNSNSKSPRGLAPIRVSKAVFGGARTLELESAYPELADINTPEISLDLQVTKLLLLPSNWWCFVDY